MAQQQETDGIVGAFVKRLNAFALGGYAFDSEHELRKGTQREAFDDYVKGLTEGHTQGYFEIPTGVGKTALFISLIRNYLAAANGAPDAKRVLIAVPSTDLVVQTAKAFAKFMPEIAPTIEADDDQGKEIDWERSGVGVQYGGMKHAGKKPKVLITTYQSLCQDKSNKTYPPSEYGLVVYDEGHNITGKKFGTAVQKFKDSLQLAVSATPDYSEDKSVANLLPHRYYHLPLEKAIERGDLCPVDPILVKTNYTIDEKKFKKYLAEQDGRQLTTKQYESLLNQESRNLAAIKTYLLGKDANTGDRYLGDTGMIFAGGVQHCNDFVRQMEKVVNNPDYRPVKDWLKAEGVELIAPIHNGIKSVELTIDGKKGSYTKDQVKELHRKGKVLLLVSDKELKEGTDFPRDSIIMELVDRLSVVDATQRYGRGFRLDLPDSANDNPEGNPYKRCRVFNMVDNNTYQIYENHPQMLPIYCSEILGGAAYREPMKRTHIINRFKNDVPDIHEKLEDSGFEVVTDFERVKAVSRKYQERKKEVEVPTLPEDKQHWVIGFEICKRLNATSADKIEQTRLILEATLLDSQTKYDLSQGEKGEFAGVYTSSELIGRYKNPSTPALYADPRLIPIIAEKLAIIPRFPEDRLHWLSMKAVCSALLIAPIPENRAKVEAHCKQILSDTKIKYHMPIQPIQDSSASTEELRGKDLVGYYSKKGSPAYYADPRIVPIIRNRLKLVDRLPENKGHWLAATDLCAAIRVDTDPENTARVGSILLEIMLDSNTRYQFPANDAEGSKTSCIGSELVGQYTNKMGRTGLYADPRLVPIIAERYGIASTAPENRAHWLTGVKLCEEMHVQYTTSIALSLSKAIERMLQNKERTYEVDGEAGKIILKAADAFAQYRSAHGREILWYVDPLIVPYLREEMGLLPTIPLDRAHWIRATVILKSLSIAPSAENSKALNELLEEIYEAGGKHTVNSKTVYVNEIMGRYSIRGGGVGNLSVAPEAVGTVITKDMVLAKKAEIAAQGEADPSPQEPDKSAAPDADKGEAATTDDTRAGLKKARPEPRQSPADMTDDERAATKRGGNNRG